ncbi:filamentous hemagglutinin N-terminal domain-containing protein, partial [uncultured Phascolarctobacterium sp.]|uniref:filamentous hemagglutinin N-terminal domain-containing protein n=1 Tax=uncultured Phascolarctobacterium sp. TaxID=512296 RepID=UPI0027DC976A
MKQKDSLNKRLNTRLASLVMLSVLSVPWVASAAGNSVVANNMLPGNGQQGNVIAGKIEGGFNGSWTQGNQMNLHQTTQNAIVTWDSFSIGANASVTIRGDHNNFNMLNYVTGSESSQIYGKLNSYVGDKQGGNIYLVNPNGVQICNSAEINVGSLHIANKKIDNITTWTENTDIANALKQSKAMTNAELMSLGYINANKLVFEGERVVIDMDRLSGLDTTKADALTIVSQPYDGKSFNDNRKYDIVLGSSTPKSEKAKKWGEYIEFADNVTGDRLQGTVQAGNPDAPNQSITEFFTYRWIKDGKELEKIGEETGWGMGDHYALRYSIDLTGSDQTPIGATADNAFKGKFDGLDNSIFGLSINNSANSKGDATGLFGFTDGAIMGNVTLIAGSDSVSIQGGTTDTGAFIGHAVNTTVKGVNSTLKVSGKNNVGGIIGYAKEDRSLTYNFADPAGSVQPDSRSNELSNLTNTGNVSGVTNVGGLVGYMDGGKLSNDEENRAQYKGSYNLGKITGIDKGTDYSSNIGGLIGKAENATVSGTKNTLINYNTVEGGYNVGGIVGNAANTTVANASNEGIVKANGFTFDSYIYHTDYQSWKNYGTDMHEVKVRAANVGGIVGNSSAGSELKDVTNKADVSSALVKKSTNQDNPSGFDHYAAGNVGGIVGRAEDSNITNANNVESNIRGAMNVGGIAGYFGSTDVNNQEKKDYRILNAINNGGDIMATGGINENGGFTYEITRNDYNTQNNEKYITGNIGGIAGYLYGAPVRIQAAGNRGDVHTEADTSKRTAQAANVGGIVGKIDMPKATNSDGNVLTDDERLAIIKSDTSAAGNSGYANAVVSSSYNTGNVKGYTNIGGIGGFAYNGSIAASYNVGDIKTTRLNAQGTTPINMGGILGDSTEQANGRIIIYDTYNKGTIGDSSYTTYGRHVGGIVGRLSGIVEKSYNNGDIYNGYNVVGGIAGYWYSGYLKNVFNTGNITVYNKSNTDSQVGGIVGSVDLNGGNKSCGEIEDMSIANAYNLGSLRSFKFTNNKCNVVGGILGATYTWPSSFNPGSNHKLNISNAYTMGNLYVDNYFVGDIVGAFPKNTRSNVTFKNVYYIRPQTDNGYIDLTTPPSNIPGITIQQNAKVINYNELADMSKWGDFGFSKQTHGTITGATDDNWRMSNGASLPMLNAFLSGSHKYFSQDSNWQAFMKDNEGANVQYGTAYDPLLTIITTKKDLSFNWSDMDLKNNGSLAVFGLHDTATNLNYTPGLTLNNVEITNSTHIFGGTIYSDGLLELNAKDDLKDGLRFGMDSKLYGSDVVLNTNSSMELSGSVIATGNHNELSNFDPEKSLQHGININAADLTVYGKLITMGDEKESTHVIVPGINYGYGNSLGLDKENVSDQNKAMTSQGMTHAYYLKTNTAKTGDITINTMENTLENGTYMSGSANLLYGNYKKGKLETKGNLTVSSSGNILVDSDLDVAGSINLGGAEVPDGSGDVYVNDITLDLSNIGGELKGNDKVKALHKFIDAHSTEATGIYGNNNSEYTDDKRSMKITFDLWDDNYEVGGVTGNLNYTKYDLTEDGTTTVTLIDKLKNLYVESAGTKYNESNIRNVIYAWISNANELNSLQRVAEKLTDRDALSYNYVLKNDIDASGLVDANGKSTYNTIGRGDIEFTGTFDGNGHTIVGLQANGGLFGKLGTGAVVKNVNISSSVFTGKNTGDSVGAVAAENNGGTISNISGYGNTVKGNGGYIGGLVGKNYGGITNSDDQSTVIAGANTVAGGIAGVNAGTFDWDTFVAKVGYIDNVQSNSAVTTAGLTAGQYASNLGGIVGINEMHPFISGLGPALDTDIDNVSAHGVTGKSGSTKISGGIVGTNNGKLTNVYNESIIHGFEAIGGIAGTNVMLDPEDWSAKQATLENIANAVEIIGDAGSQNVGGLVGMQDHASANQGRNTGAITGCTNVGGMVGYNTADSYLNNLENSPQATITGITNVGGIAGVNEGEISADDQMNLVNSGEIYGWHNVGGIAGKNSGKIDNVNSNINLYVIDKETRNALKGSTDIATNAQFFGGVTGENVGIITNATNRARVDAAQASYVGGIVGKNTQDSDKVGQLLGMGNSNEGFVIGKNYVGGVIGKNEVAITGTATQSVGIVNSGTVIATAGGAGGIIGENSADITHVIMKNEGEVHGNASIEGSKEENGTGGIIGVNADGANISNSSLMNRVNGNVSGVANVGGIIGINHGVITGGRDAKDNYYKYQIYNNGTIQAGSYNATNGTITAFAGENIGGLLGNNSGTLTAGYNTGVVDAGQSSNVGGIAGTNSGTLDQVFNSVVTVTKTATGETDAEGRKLYNYTYTDGGAISGASNVGGIVGSNKAGGKLSNAYSSTAVAGVSNVANIVGSNAGQVSNIYGYAENGNTNVNGSNVSNSYIIKKDGTLAENGNDAKKLGSYDFDDKDKTWKLYDKRTNPLLKVFLTKVTVADDLPKGWVYDATNHLDIHGWIENGKLTTNDPANDAFKAYKNNNSLLQGEELKNVDTYSSWLWSGQIASGGEVGPNNLGYDFTVGDITVTKKVLNVTGNTVNRTYGDLLKKHDYALSINGFDGFNDAMKAELDGKVTITDSQDTIQNSKDTGIITVGDEKRTKDKGAYNWHAGVKLDESLIGNYEFINDGESSTTTTVHGVSNVLARKVYLNNINANLTYGSNDAINNHINGVVSIKDLANAIVYGDNVKLADGAVVNVKDGSSYATNKGGRNTADAGTYDNSLKIDNAALTGDASKLGNYELVNDATGSITVDQATMHVKLNDVERTYGNTALINGTAYGVNSLLGNVNGDNYAAGDVTINKVTGDGALTGASTGKVTNDADDAYTWNANVVTANDKLKQNYKLVVDDGASVVKQATLQVSLNDVVRTYGNATITSGGYSASGIEGLVNGDNYDASAITVNKTSDGAIAGVSGSKVTNDAGGYTWSGTLTTDNAALKNNYKLELKGDGKSVVGKATLNVGLSDVYRTYGNAKITNGSYSAGNITGLVNGDNYNANDFRVTVNSDGAIAGVTGDRVTNDHGDYTWSGTVEANNAGLNKNYDLVVNANGKSYVDKAQLNVSLNDVVRTYGNATITSGGYGVSGITGLVNGDSYNAGDVKVTVTGDGALTGNTEGKVTNNAGDYTWSGTATTDNAGLGKNYNLVVTANGKSTVEKAMLNVGLSDVVRTYGNAAITSGAYSAGNITGLVNGDSYNAGDVKVTVTGDGATDGVSGSKVTNDAGNYEWTGSASTTNAGLDKNYNLVVKGNGKSKVEKATLNVGLNDVVRTYGNATITSGGYSASNITGLVNGDSYKAGDVKVTVTGDGALTGNTEGKVTNDAGDYSWSGTLTADNAGLDKNYKLVVTANGKSKVEKATLNVGLNDVVRTYGNATITSGGYSASKITGLVNGDSYNASDVKVTVTGDGALTGASTGKVTNDAGDYSWSGTLTADNAGLDKNYKLVVTANGKSKVEKATLNVGLNDVVRTYGNATITSGGYSASGITGLVNGDSYKASDVKVTVTGDGALTGNTEGKVTNDAGDYSWSGTLTADNAGLDKNYKLVVTANGKSKVEKATLNVGLNDVVRTYGNATITSGGYSASGITGLVNGDSYKASDVKVTVTGDGALTGNTEGKVTNDAGDYTWSGTATTDNAGLDKNYNLVVTANGKSKVEKATLKVGLNDVVRTYGNATITSGGYSAGNITGLVNGDSYDASAITVNKTSDGAIAGVSGSRVTNDAGKYEWTGSASTTNAGLDKNYNLVVTANGKSKVEKANLVVNLNDITRVYGNLDAKDYSNAFTFGNNAGLVNGDNGLVINANKDGAITGGTLTNVEKTNNVGSYEWNGTASGVDNLNTNYDVTVNAGKSDVTKANLVVNLNDITRVYGNLDAKDYSKAFTFGNNAGLVNGDNGLV